MAPQPCRYYLSSNGCRKGESCQFAHSKDSASPGSVASPNSSTSRGDSPRRQFSNSSIPRGVCRYYWRDGRCRMEFECRFEHDRPDTAHKWSHRSNGNFMSIAVKNMIAPFLTENGLAKIKNATDGFFGEIECLSPTDAHRKLKRFLTDDFKFKTSFEIYAFLVPLCSATPSNTLWTQEEGQLLLSSLASPNGSLRIVDIITWPEISLRAGQNRQVLSFQRGILPLLRYLSSEYVIKSTLITKANHLYTIVLQNLPRFAEVIEACLDQAIKSHSFGDPTTLLPGQIDVQVFVSVARVLHEFLVRFKNAIATYSQLVQLARCLSENFRDWHSAIIARPEAFGNSLNGLQPAAREYVLGSIKEQVDIITSIVEREEGKLMNSKEKKHQAHFSAADPQDALVAALHTMYEGPGHLREKGPRHDNDFDDIYEIRIAPTNMELLCRLPPFLPANIFGAPHPAAPSSMQRLLDIQFRLLREELIAPLRMAVQLVYDDLEKLQIRRTKLWDLLQKQGGKYRSLVDTQDSLMFNVYTGVQFRSLDPGWKGISVRIVIDTPPGRGRSGPAGQRVSFWESMSGKRLSQGGLIALVWKSERGTTVHLGVIASSSRELTDSVRLSPDYIELRIVFFDASIELRILEELRKIRHSNSYSDTKLLVESPVMFEAIRPFLQALQTEPEDIPFSRYLVHQPSAQLETIEIQPPQYARLPDFKFELSSLFDAESRIDHLTLTISDRESVQRARSQLRQRSRLDPSQADAVVDALTREVALIQGPPGTGKSFTGVEILRVLQANKVGPILMIAFTNHALDHMLCSVLDAKITDRIVRLGRRATDERIAQYSIETLEMVQKHSRLDNTFNTRRDLKNVQEEIKNLMGKVVKVETDSAEIMKYISTYHPEHHAYFLNPPEWLLEVIDDGEDDEGVWQRAGPRRKFHAEDNSHYAFWNECRDLAFIDQVVNGIYSRPKPPSDRTLQRQNAFSSLPVEEDGQESDSDLDSDSDDREDTLDVQESWKDEQYEIMPPDSEYFSDKSSTPVSFAECLTSPIDSDADEPLQPEDFLDRNAFFLSFGFKHPPSIPSTDRPLEELLDHVGDVWSMSQSERQRIHKFWVEEARNECRESSLCEFQRLRDLHSQKLREVNEITAEVRRSLLQRIDIIGCTTTGAAQLTTLLKGLSPKVLLVEEAGQVMEAHILGTLVPSIEHLILIGDPLQLRPTLNNYSLSMDNRRGRALYRFDMSLMERLSSSGLAMSRIDVQRRMRPAISSLIRNTLYPKLEDHDLVCQYPDVRGVQKNVFFVTHQHKENDGGDDTASKYNTYEVAMISDLVLYLLRQGCYSSEGDIVVLCAYLGQLARLRDALRNQVAVIIDERDQAALDDQESDGDQSAGEVTIERVNVTKRVRLRTVDNYQGEEGRIVILSLVRNAGGLEDDLEIRGFAAKVRPTIGFLKSENRTNVALSRAREGLFIFGNVDNLSSRSKMWGKIIEELEGVDCVGPALPIACFRHPDRVEYVSKPGMLPQFSPDGGCLQPCETRLKCGHNCPFKCHSDDPHHVTIICTQPCRRLCTRGSHPCRKLCSRECGQCLFSIKNVELPCGHIKKSVECFRLDNLDAIYCDFKMEKPLPTCEHSAVMACGQDPSLYSCNERCGSTLKCCSKSCNARCHECQSENIPQAGERIIRTQHRTHPCESLLYCGHRCQEHCSEGHDHTSKCLKTCRQSCSHAQCRKPCSTLCSPCQEPCAWVCPHGSCPVPCGSVCVRMPCDFPCTNLLACGHKCPSLCGEDCALQVCPECAPADKKDQVVDVILSRTLSDMMPELGGFDDLIITNPSCGHIFTVETLDGLTNLNDFYSRDQDVWIGLEAPIGVVKPPTCPNCRAPITCNRYGRIIKRANLDILERNVASHMSQSLDRWHNSIRGFDENAALNILAAAASTLHVSASRKPLAQQKLNKARKALLDRTEEKPISFADISAENKKLHYIDSAVIEAWKKATKPLFDSYKDIVKIADNRSAHTKAWEAAFSFLYEREIEAGLKDPHKMPRNPEQHALRMAKLQVGQPRPLADRRFLVEAFWGSVHIRLTLIRLAQKWIEDIDSRSSSKVGPFHIQQWATYIDFLLKTCTVDAEKAFQIAEDSKSHRQVIKSVLHRLRIELEAFRFNLHMCKMLGTFKNSDKRNALGEKAAELGTKCEEHVRVAVMVYTMSSPEDEEWVEENFSKAARTIVDEWSKIEASIRLDTFYQPVSLEEKMDIIRAFSFGTTGHFYTCPNGHIYTITECGGAMERSRCPECGEEIGGENHHLVSTNNVANEIEDLARRVNPNLHLGFWRNPY